MDDHPPLPLGQYDAAIGLPARVRRLPASSESEALGVMDAALLQYSWWALYETAHQLARDVVRLTRMFVAHVAESPHPEVRTNVYMFLCMTADELHGGVVASTEMFYEMLRWAGEQVGRKVVCSLMSIVRWARREQRDARTMPASA